MARYLVGIDLGTTNSALAFIDMHGYRPGAKPPAIRPFAVPQLVAPGEVGDRELLPSFLYLPGSHDLPPGATALPWDPTSQPGTRGQCPPHPGQSPSETLSPARHCSPVPS